jgi:hypothetical protein
MKYLAFVGTEGPQPPDALVIMQRDFPAWLEEMDRRGVRLLGRELDFPEKAATVRVRDGQTLVTDGPFAETKEFVAGFDLLDCAGLEEVIEVAAKSPAARFCPLEIRPLREEPRLSPAASAFGRSDDAAGGPYLLMVWVGETPAVPLEEQPAMQECGTWRQELEHAACSSSGARWAARTRPPRSSFVTGRCGSATARSSASRSSSPASRSSAAPIAGRPSSSLRRTRSRGTTRSSVRSTASDRAGRWGQRPSARAPLA